MTTETITGTLHVHRSVKELPGETPRTIIKYWLKYQLPMADGTIRPRPEYPPIYWITTGKKAEFNGKVYDHEYQYRFKGQPKAFSEEMDGWIVTVRGILEPWTWNGHGAYVTRYKVISIIPPPNSPAGEFAKFLVDNSESTGIPGLFELKPKENTPGGSDPER